MKYRNNHNFFLHTFIFYAISKLLLILLQTIQKEKTNKGRMKLTKCTGYAILLRTY